MDIHLRAVQRDRVLTCLFIAKTSAGFGVHVEHQMHPDHLTPGVFLYTDHLFVAVREVVVLGVQFALSQLQLLGGIGT